MVKVISKLALESYSFVEEDSIELIDKNILICESDMELIVDYLNSNSEYFTVCLSGLSDKCENFS